MWKIFDVKNNSFMKHFMYCIKMDFARCVVCTQRVVFFTEQKKIEFPEKYKRLEQYRERKRFILTPQQGFFPRNIWENAVLSAVLKT